jgi:hypothetical protein
LSSLARSWFLAFSLRLGYNPNVGRKRRLGKATFVSTVSVQPFRRALPIELSIHNFGAWFVMSEPQVRAIQGPYS